jgi:hypothetical protein
MDKPGADAVAAGSAYAAYTTGSGAGGEATSTEATALDWQRTPPVKVPPGSGFDFGSWPATAIPTPPARIFAGDLPDEAQGANRAASEADEKYWASWNAARVEDSTGGKSRFGPSQWQDKLGKHLPARVQELIQDIGIGIYSRATPEVVSWSQERGKSLTIVMNLSSGDVFEKPVGLKADDDGFLADPIPEGASNLVRIQVTDTKPNVQISYVSADKSTHSLDSILSGDTKGLRGDGHFLVQGTAAKVTVTDGNNRELTFHHKPPIPDTKLDG